jgi:hypothetical protein
MLFLSEYNLTEPVEDDFLFAAAACLIMALENQNALC